MTRVGVNAWTTVTCPDCDFSPSPAGIDPNAPCDSGLQTSAQTEKLNKVVSYDVVLLMNIVPVGLTAVGEWMKIQNLREREGSEACEEALLFKDKMKSEIVEWQYGHNCGEVNV